MEYAYLIIAIGILILAVYTVKNRHTKKMNKMRAEEQAFLMEEQIKAAAAKQAKNKSS